MIYWAGRNPHQAIACRGSLHGVPVKNAEGKMCEQAKQTCDATCYVAHEV